MHMGGVLDVLSSNGLLMSSANTEQLEDRIMKHNGVPVQKGKFGVGNMAEDILPFVDGRCVTSPDNEDHWCTVSQSKDCWPEQEWTPSKVFAWCHLEGDVKGSHWSIRWNDRPGMERR